jgi:predicted CXXCH cytochrome family protein
VNALKRYWHFLSLLLATAVAAAPALAGTPLPDIPKAVKGEQCVEDTQFMRKNHMELLMHQRDETMHKGIRTKKHSLKECFSCHVVKGADNKPVTAADPRHFCSQCHSYAAVQVDCFQCHASTPSADANAPYRAASRTEGGHL